MYSLPVMIYDVTADATRIITNVVVGTYGQAVTFSKEKGQLTYEESTGSKVYPESLYEAQLKRRLGTLPAWIKTVK